MNYVEQTYRDVLQREGDAAGIAFWTAQVDAGHSGSEFASLIDHSAEYFGTNIIKPAYAKYLGREADSAGIDFWTAQFRAGMRDEQLEANFIGSPEYFNFTGGNNLQWVDAMYRDLLGRGADAAGEKFWTGQLAAGISRSTVAFGFANSPE